METLDLIKTLKAKKWLDLSHNINEEIPHFGAFAPSSHKTLFTVENDGFFAKEYHFATQYGTHIDAPNHFAVGKRSLAELSLKELVLPLYVIHKEAEVAVNPDYEVSLQDVLDFEAEYAQFRVKLL